MVVSRGAAGWLLASGGGSQGVERLGGPLHRHQPPSAALEEMQQLAFASPLTSWRDDAAVLVAVSAEHEPVEALWRGGPPPAVGLMKDGQPLMGAARAPVEAAVSCCLAVSGLVVQGEERGLEEQQA